MSKPPLDYQPPGDDLPPRGPWWKLRFERHHLGPLIFLLILLSIAPLHALYVESLQKRRLAPTPTPPPAPATRPALNIPIPPL